MGGHESQPNEGGREERPGDHVHQALRRPAVRPASTDDVVLHEHVRHPGERSGRLPAHVPAILQALDGEPRKLPVTLGCRINVVPGAGLPLGEPAEPRLGFFPKDAESPRLAVNRPTPDAADTRLRQAD